MKKYMRYPIIPITFFYVNGIFFSNQIFSFFASELIWGFLVFFFLIYILLFFKTKFLKISKYLKLITTISAYFIFFLVGTISFQINKVENKLTTSQYHLGVLTINEVLKSNSFQNRYLAKFCTTENIEQRILIYQNKEETLLKVGNRIQVPLFIENVPNAKNPYQFDYSKYLANKQVFVQAKLTNEYTILAPAEGFRFQLLYFRETLMNSFKSHHFTNEVNGVINALLFGQRADLSEKIQNDYRNAGVMHILAISGMHIGILYWIMNLIFSSFIRSKNIRFLTVISILVCFAIITGLSGSVVRAVLMFIIVGSGIMVKRKTSSINVLALSLLIILIFNPLFLFDIGLQLSYLAVFSIVYFYPLIRPFFQSRFLVLKYFFELVGISIVAQIGILPLTVYYFGQIPLLFLLGNLIVIPILTFVLIALVFLLILNFVWNSLSVFLGKGIAFLIDFVNNAIGWIASQTDFIITNIKLSGFQCILFLGLIFMIAYVIKQYSYRKIIFILVLIIGIQMSFFYDISKIKENNQMHVLYDYNSVTLAKINQTKMWVFSDDTLVLSKKYIVDLQRESEIHQVDFKKIINFFKIEGLRFLVVDSLGISEISTSIDVLILKDNPKFNLERYLQNHQPKLVVFHPKNYNTNVAFWSQTCTEKKIPFHNMREKGFVNLSD
ncbi:ComEC/Rec2 family competence protein [Flavobacterium sp. I3-2]|uniref:ComEC/Rec2 family competence protein n=1 Tax=Flavobacterium sp. I3-2 TaxID=2748319 RepID=UPI0015ADFE4F|nr:ComEC/Rec2 family competence protein [Flavobacterium sp. I3-2]